MRTDHDTQLRHVFSVTSGATPASGNREFWDGEIPWVTPADLSGRISYWLEDTRRKITPAGYESSGTTMVPAHSIVLSKRAPIGQLAVLKRSACSNQGCFLLTPKNEADTRFYYYWLSCEVGHLQALGCGSTFMELSIDDLKSIRIPNPSPRCQRAIADCLDQETSRLDALVAEKERLMELLQEKRAVLISHAVTKGLDSDMPLKDSGVEWLGEIPAHWTLKRIKYLLVGRKDAIKTGPFGSQLHSSEMTDKEIKVFNQRTVIDRDIHGGLNYISMAKFNELKAFEAFPGDLLVTTRGTIGRCMIIPSGAPRGILHPCLLRIQIDTRLADEHYIELLIEESGLILAQLQWMSNATTIEVIYSDSLKETLLPIPPLPEQHAITAFLDRETAKIDGLVTTVREGIDHLKERRAALIAAAVTGQINVESAS